MSSKVTRSESKEPLAHLVNVKDKILLVRNEHVIIDADVAELYGVETKRINEAVRNNANKFPDGYMLCLSKDEVNDLRSNNSSTNLSTKSRVLPKAFTEKGLYMLATILKSKQAVEVTSPVVIGRKNR